MQRWAHGVNANPFAGSSEDSISSGSFSAGGWAGTDSTYPPAPPPSPTTASPHPASAAATPADNTLPPPAHMDADVSARSTIFAPTPSRPEASVDLSPLLTPLIPTAAMTDPEASVDLSPRLTPLIPTAAATLANVAHPSGGSAFVPFKSPAPSTSIKPLEPKTTTFEASSSRAPSLPVNDLDMHELHFNKASAAAKRARRYSDKGKRSTELLRRSDRLARKEPRVYTSMTDRASKAKAARLGNGSSDKPFLDALHASALDDPAAPLASPAALALLAQLCGADTEQVDSVRNAEAGDDPVRINVSGGDGVEDGGAADGT